MHIPDGIIPVQAALGGYAAAGGAAWLTLVKIRRKYKNPREAIPRASLLTAVFLPPPGAYPLPPTSVHLVLRCQ